MVLGRNTLFAFIAVVLTSGCDDVDSGRAPQEAELLSDEGLFSPDALVDPEAPLPEGEGPVTPATRHPRAAGLRAAAVETGANPSNVPWTLSPAPECSANADCDFGQRCDPASNGGVGGRYCVSRCSTDADCNTGEKCGAADFCVVLSKGDWDFCESGGCERGHGDCDDSADCDGSLSCMLNIGSAWGYSSGVDVCDYPAGHAGYCSAEHPCGGSQGDCDSHAECGFGLVCKNDRGGEFGFASWVDVCLPPWQ